MNRVPPVWRVALVEDNHQTREFLESCIQGDRHLSLVASFATLQPAQAWFLDHEADLLLVDLGLPDGSGLSRYNLFTPQDFVTILNKMKNEFGMERIKNIFPTGGAGTISSYYKVVLMIMRCRCNNASNILSWIVSCRGCIPMPCCSGVFWII